MIAVPVLPAIPAIVRRNDARFFMDEHEVIVMEDQVVSSPAHGAEVWQVPMKRKVASFAMEFDGRVYHLKMWLWNKMGKAVKLSEVEAHFAAKDPYSMKRSAMSLWTFARRA